MKVLKRNQIIILVVSLMLITAGYLNFTNTNQAIETTSVIGRDDTTLGDAKLVSTTVVNNTITSNALVENNEIVAETEVKEEIKETASSQEDYYFTNSRLERESMYSQLLETYQEMYNNSSATSEQKQNAISEITKISNTKNAIMIAENLISAKGFKNVVIFVNEGSVSIVVETEELKQEEVAQIQNIVSRELNVSAETIHISNK